MSEQYPLHSDTDMNNSPSTPTGDGSEDLMTDDYHSTDTTTSGLRSPPQHPAFSAPLLASTPPSSSYPPAWLLSSTSVHPPLPISAAASLSAAASPSPARRQRLRRRPAASRLLLLMPPPPPSQPSARSSPDQPTSLALTNRTAALPDEVLLSIFERLQNVRDVAAVRGVCNAWRHLVDQTATIWRSLVFELPRCASNAPYAEFWYRKAADYGNAQAQFLLALLYTYGYSGSSRSRGTFRHDRSR